MRRTDVKYLVDPVSRKKFRLESYSCQGEQIMAGLLVSGKRWYPIISGVPRILTAELKKEMLRRHFEFLERFKKDLPKRVVKEWRAEIDQIEDLDAFMVHQRKTADSFAFEWNKIYQENDFEKNNFLHFLSPFVKEVDLRAKVVLDAGCGSGRFCKQAAKAKVKMVVGVDLGESVELAYRLNRKFKNVCIIQGDIYQMPVFSGFDLVYSIGVLHHLPEPEKGFLGLSQFLKKKGKMLVWVYNRRNNNRAVYIYEPLRTVTRRLPKKLLYYLCFGPAAVVEGFNRLTKFLNFLGVKKIAKKIPFFYYANFPFNMKLNDAFDVLATPKSNLYYVKEIEDWFKRARLLKIKSFEHPEAGITCVGEKNG